MRMSKTILQVDNVEVNKQKFHASKERIALDLVNVKQILISDKFKHSDIGYKDVNNVRPLCIALPQMNGYQKKYVPFD